MVGDTILVSGLSSTLYGFNAKDGVEAGEFLAPAEITAPPETIGSSDGSIALILLTGDGKIQRLGHSFDPPLSPLRRLPGTPLPPEDEPPPGE